MGLEKENELTGITDLLPGLMELNFVIRFTQPSGFKFLSAFALAREQELS